MLIVVLTEIVCSRWQKLAKQVKILKLQYTRPLSIALKSKPQEMVVNIQKIISFFWKTKLIQIKYLIKSPLSIVFALYLFVYFNVIDMEQTKKCTKK